MFPVNLNLMKRTSATVSLSGVYVFSSNTFSRFNCRRLRPRSVFIR